MADPISSSTELRARLAIMEQKLRSDISNMARSAAMRGTTVAANDQKRRNSTASDTATKVAVDKQPSEQNRDKNQATIGTKKHEIVSKSIAKSFKWTAPVQISGVSKSPSPRKMETSSLTSQSILPGAITKVLHSNKSTSIQSPICKSVLTSPISAKFTSPNNDASKISGLLARIKSVNEEVAISYSEVFSGRSNGSGPTNSSSNSWTTPVAAAILPTSKKSTVSKKTVKNVHKWESSSVKRKRKELPLKKGRSEDLEKLTGKSKKKKTCWNKKDGDFTFIPIATHQYCMFFNKFGSCRSGSSCVFKHDSSKVAVCRSFLQNRCTDKSCPLCHTADPDKVPDCEFFARELCFKDNCVYRHIKFNENTEPCSDFLNGFCPSGRNCKSRHLDKASAPIVKEIMKKKRSARKKKKEETDLEISQSLYTEVICLEFSGEIEEISSKESNAKKEIPKKSDMDMVETDLFIPLLNDIGENDFDGVENQNSEEELIQKNGTDNNIDKELENTSNKTEMERLEKERKSARRKSLTVKFLACDLDDDKDSRNGTYVSTISNPPFDLNSPDSTVLAVTRDNSEMEITQDIEVEVEVEVDSSVKTANEEAVKIITELKSAEIFQFLPTQFLFCMTEVLANDNI